MGKSPSKNAGLKGFIWGFVLGVIATILFFYFGGFSTLSRQGTQVEKKVQKSVQQGVQDTNTAVDKMKEKTKEAIKEKLE